MATGLELSIDFGTSSTVAVLRRDDGQPRPLLFDGTPLLPSAVCLSTDGILLTGRDALHEARRDPSRLEPAPKSRLGEGRILLGDREVEAVAAVAAVLRRVAVEAERVGGHVDRLTMTHPAGWAATRRGLLVDAARRTGLPSPRLIAEPVAAASYFTEVLGNRIAPGSAVVVYDFGAGTFDASVVTRGASGFDTALVDGDDVGGMDIDAGVIEWVGQLYGTRDPERWHRLLTPRDMADRRSREYLWSDARMCKELLSRTTSTSLSVPVLDVEAHLTRDELERLARPLIQRTVHTTREVLRQSRLPAEQITGIFLVGGSSRIPMVASMLLRELSIAPTAIEQPEQVVAEGSLRVPGGERAGHTEIFPVLSTPYRATPGATWPSGAARGAGWPETTPGAAAGAVMPAAGTPAIAPPGVGAPGAVPPGGGTPFSAVPGGAAPVPGTSGGGPTGAAAGTSSAPAGPARPSEVPTARLPAPAPPARPAATADARRPAASPTSGGARVTPRGAGAAGTTTRRGTTAGAGRPPSGTVVRARPSSGRHRVLPWVLVLLLVVVLGGVGWYAWRHRQAGAAQAGTGPGGTGSTTGSATPSGDGRPSYVPASWRVAIASINAGNGWRGDTDGCTVSGGSLAVVHSTGPNASRMYECTGPTTVFTDLAISTTLRVDSGCAGIWVRTGDVHGYFVDVCDGTVALYLVSDRDPSPENRLAGWQVDTGDTLRVGVLVRGQQLTVYADDTALGDPVGNDGIATGRVDLGVFTGRAQTAHAVFRRARVWSPA